MFIRLSERATYNENYGNTQHCIHLLNVPTLSSLLCKNSNVFFSDETSCFSSFSRLPATASLSMCGSTLTYALLCGTTSSFDLRAAYLNFCAGKFGDFLTASLSRRLTLTSTVKSVIELSSP